MIDTNIGIMKSIFNDPHLREQWYLLKSNPLKTHLSHEINNLWDHDLTGKGTVIAIVGGGVEVEHKDLKGNHYKNLSYNFLRYSPEIYESHSGGPTNAAGLISAVANNNECGVGVAPSSKFASLQIFDNKYSFLDDHRLAAALSYQNIIIDIYLINWNLDYRHEINFIPGPDTISTLVNGYRYGRFGLGSIFVTSSGNYRSLGNNCAFNGILQRPEIFVFGTLTSSGNIPKYLEKCTAVLASSLSTHDFMEKDKVYAPTSNNLCLNSTSGTFVSSSISAGIIALLISFNPLLTNRQIMIGIILSSIQYDRYSILNAAQMSYSYFLGFGLIDPLKFIKLSISDEIKNIPPENVCKTRIFTGIRKIPRGHTYILYMYTSGCSSSFLCVDSIEQVLFSFTLLTRSRKSFQMFITSPGGTRLKILYQRRFDTSKNGFANWAIKILGYFGESSLGVWKLELVSVHRLCSFLMFEFIFYGTCRNPTISMDKHIRVMNFLYLELGKNENMTDENSLLTKCYSPDNGRDSCSFTGEEFPQMLQITSIIN